MVSEIKYSIVIPCYNESDNIPLILERFQSCINRDDVEVILVNNGSKDNTAEVLKLEIAKYPFAKTFHVPENIGYGFGITSGLEVAQGDFIGWTHADMQTDPNDVIKSFEIIDNLGSNENLYIKGVRKGRAIKDFLFSYCMAIFESILFQKVVYEINAQPNIFHKSFYKRQKNLPKDFSLDLFIYIKAIKENLKIERINVLFPERIHGESKWQQDLSSKITAIKRAILFSIKLRFNKGNN